MSLKVAEHFHGVKWWWQNGIGACSLPLHGLFLVVWLEAHEFLAPPLETACLIARHSEGFLLGSILPLIFLFRYLVFVSGFGEWSQLLVVRRYWHLRQIVSSIISFFFLDKLIATFLVLFLLPIHCTHHSGLRILFLYLFLFLVFFFSSTFIIVQCKTQLTSHKDINQ